MCWILRQGAHNDTSWTWASEEWVLQKTPWLRLMDFRKRFLTRRAIHATWSQRSTNLAPQPA